MSSPDEYNRQLNEKKASLATLFSFLKSEINDTVVASDTQRLEPRNPQHFRTLLLSFMQWGGSYWPPLLWLLAYINQAGHG